MVLGIELSSRMYNIAALLMALIYVVCEVSSLNHQPPLPDWITGRRSIGHGNPWGGVGTKFGDMADIFDRDELGYAFDDRDRIGYTFGNRGAADRFFEFVRHIAEGRVEGALESGGHSSNDVEGAKKYSYFTEGSGPNGFYSRGYFGSNGYDHEDAKLAAIKDANRGAYRKGFESMDTDTGLARSAWDKHSAGKERHGFGLDHGARLQGASEHNKAGRNDGWKAIRSGNASDHRCQRD